MLRYLAHPYQLLGVVVAVLVGLVGHNLGQVATARLVGNPVPARSGWWTLRPTRHIEALGAVAAALAFYGWSFAAPVPVTGRLRAGRLRAAIALLAGPAVLFALTALVVAGTARTSSVQLLEAGLTAQASLAGLLVLSLLPLPPLAVGRVVFLYAPTTAGWQRARYQLLETPLGGLLALAVVLVPVVLPGFPDIVGDFVGPLLGRLNALFA